MKRIGNLFEQFIAFPNLLQAYYKARKGIRRNQENSFFFVNLEAELLQLQEELQNLTYAPQPYRYFQIYDPKERTISVAAFRDRVVHHALVNVLEPIYEKRFIHDSYATRKGKGTHAAILKAQKMLREHSWFLKSDVDKYFESISQERLLAILAHKIKDKQLLDITARIIRNGGSQGYGLPIGNLTSQFFANVYLNELDSFVKKELKVKRYIRYMDDFVLFAPNKQVLKIQLQAIQQFLVTDLELRLKSSATFVNQASNGLTFLGKRIYPQMIRLARPNLVRMLRRMSIREQEWKQGEINEETYLDSMNSYWACLSFGDTFGLRSNLASSTH